MFGWGGARIMPHRGIGLAMEAHGGYRRRPPKVKRIVMKAIPDQQTGLVALKRDGVDYACSIRGSLAEEASRTPGLNAGGLIRWRGLYQRPKILTHGDAP